jgi:hypothetical protein
LGTHQVSDGKTPVLPNRGHEVDQGLNPKNVPAQAEGMDTTTDDAESFKVVGKHSQLVGIASSDPQVVETSCPAHQLADTDMNDKVAEQVQSTVENFTDPTKGTAPEDQMNSSSENDDDDHVVELAEAKDVPETTVNVSADPYVSQTMISCVNVVFGFTSLSSSSILCNQALNS